MSVPTLVDQRRARRALLSSLVAASAADVVLTGLEPQYEVEGKTQGIKLNSRSLKKGYKIDTTLLGGNRRHEKSIKRTAESKQAEKEHKKRKGLVDALFPEEADAEHPTGREFHASSTNQGMCDYVEFALRASLSKNATPEAFNNFIVPFDDTAVQALAIVIEEVARGQVETWKGDLLPLLKKQKLPKNPDGNAVEKENEKGKESPAGIAADATADMLDSDSDGDDH